jgi:hypothetical protein
MRHSDTEELEAAARTASRYHNTKMIMIDRSLPALFEGRKAKHPSRRIRRRRRWLSFVLQLINHSEGESEFSSVRENGARNSPENIASLWHTLFDVLNRQGID